MGGQAKSWSVYRLVCLHLVPSGCALLEFIIWNLSHFQHLNEQCQRHNLIFFFLLTTIFIPKACGIGSVIFYIQNFWKCSFVNFFLISEAPRKKDDYYYKSTTIRGNGRVSGHSHRTRGQESWVCLRRSHFYLTSEDLVSSLALFPYC